METYTTENCDRCGKPNRICLGDFTDLTAPDVECFTCWSCGQTQWLSEVDNVVRKMAQDAGEQYGYTAKGEPPVEAITDERRAEAIVSVLNDSADAKEVMGWVSQYYCLLCWKKLDGRQCYCAPAYDE